MTQSNNHIYEFVFNNDKLNNRINRLVVPDLRKDMKQHIVLILNSMDSNKLNKLYNNNELIKYTMIILYQQMSKKCSNCFYQLYYPKIFTQDNPLFTPSEETHYELPQVINQQLIDTQQIKDKLVKEIFSAILNLEIPGSKRLSMYEIFFMSYIQGFTNQQIAVRTHLGIQSIINYKRKVLKDIKNKFKQNGYNIN